MKRAALVLLVLVLALPVGASGTLSETERLRADNLKLRIALLNAQQRELQQAAEALERERIELEAAFRLSLKADPNMVFNWNTYTFEEPKK